MASSIGGGEEQLQKMAELSKTLKEGERILAPTRRPDGTLRKPIRIRAGYVPQEEVAIYQSKGALWKKEMAASQVVPPGYDPPADAKPKTKSAKRNERKKEKRLQAALEKGKNSEAMEDNESKGEDVTKEDLDDGSESVKSLTSQMTDLAFSPNPVSASPPSNSVEASDVGQPVLDLDKKIRALKKKIRLAEAQQQETPQQDMKPEQLEKLAKLEGWRDELELLEGTKAELAAL
ncbi:partner of Y14 and mago-like isoform X2 [Hibiscus syriacus]|uniref:Partner of Y14 and mago-like isoform X2 n=1 Tax=Hibiscus syriacus TaxID=106335 RepID=A0A6A3CBF3_HIBSY|nr:partner of Y14 and mago-like isoform X1 [Hibiscus syriacus]KAE8725994.1 partner of Y14 and mago-like isoform X2 [Hibiscus syriacus]